MWSMAHCPCPKALHSKRMHARDRSRLCLLSRRRPWTFSRLHIQQHWMLNMYGISDSYALPLLVSLGLAGLLLALFPHPKYGRTPPPPGPKGSFVLGCTKDMLDPSVKPWDRFDKWTRQYHADKGLLCVPTLAQSHIIIKYVTCAYKCVVC
jgi:hypothetical protein